MTHAGETKKRVVNLRVAGEGLEGYHVQGGRTHIEGGRTFKEYRNYMLGMSMPCTITGEIN